MVTKAVVLPANGFGQQANTDQVGSMQVANPEGWQCGRLAALQKVREGKCYDTGRQSCTCNAELSVGFWDTT
jgi:hypothetical protein